LTNSEINVRPTDRCLSSGRRRPTVFLQFTSELSPRQRQCGRRVGPARSLG